MKLVQKLAKARIELSKKEIKKTGKNKFSNYDYYQLQDFMPSVIELEQRLGFITLFNKGKEEAYIEVIDFDSDDKLVFKSDVKEATLKGAHAVQNLGAEHTYIKRYLYMNVFEITEGEVLDSDQAQKEDIDGKKVQLEYLKMQKNKLAQKLFIEANENKELARKIADATSVELGFDDFESYDLKSVSEKAFINKFVENLKANQKLMKEGI